MAGGVSSYSRSSSSNLGTDKQHHCHVATAMWRGGKMTVPSSFLNLESMTTSLEAAKSV